MLQSCRGFCSVPGPLQTVQRAEFWRFILALQAADGVHLGVVSLGVVRHVGRLLDGNVGSRPPELVKDGDLILLLGRMLRLSCLDTVRVTKVKGHADEAMVWVVGIVNWIAWVTMLLMRRLTLVAGGLNLRLLMLAVILLGLWQVVSRSSYFTSFFFNAISQAAVNHDDGSGHAPDPFVWSAGALPKVRRVVHAVRDRVFLLPGSVDLWEGEWISLGASPITAGDVEVWAYSVGLLVKLSAFLGTLHWPAAALNLGGGGVSFVEILILYELWAGERLDHEKAVPRYRRPGREISVSTVPCGPGNDIWRSFL